MKSLGNSSIAVAYMRVSKEEQHLGPEAQRQQIERWASGREVTVVKWFLDQGITGAVGIDQRPELAKAIHELRARKAGWLVLAKRDRIARDVPIVVAIEKAVEAAGARLASADGTPTDDSPTSVFQRQILDSVAQLERGFIRARTKAALAVKRERGERVGNIPYGQRLAADGVHLEPEPTEQRVIEAARTMRERGITLRGIASLLDVEGYKTRTGTAFTHIQVGKMLGWAPRPRIVRAPGLSIERQTANRERVLEAIRRGAR